MSHQAPTDDSMCGICFCPIDADTYCEYKSHEDDTTWTPSPLCLDCIEHLRTTQWKRHLDMVEKIDCRRAAIEICNNVPLFVHERSVLKCAQHGEECPLKGQIELIWTMNDNREWQPILDGAKIGQERIEYITHLLQYAELFQQEKEDEIQALQQTNTNTNSTPISSPPTSPLQSSQQIPPTSPQVLSQHSPSYAPHSPNYSQ